MTIAVTPPQAESGSAISVWAMVLPLGAYGGVSPMEQSHVSALQLKHAGLERRIQDELNRPLPDLAIIQQLKRRKLRIKEELEHF
jgi:hypothetical protein